MVEVRAEVRAVTQVDPLNCTMGYQAWIQWKTNMGSDVVLLVTIPEPVMSSYEKMHGDGVQRGHSILFHLASLDRFGARANKVAFMRPLTRGRS